MNKHEAIDILTGLYRIPVENGADKFASEINKAIDMAIGALQEPKREWTIQNCPKCGKFVLKDWIVCPYCGANMRSEEE